MSVYYPDRWVVLEVTDPTTSITNKKIFAGWYGGYLGSDEWRLSSGIEKVVEHEDHYEVHNVSGSVYKCSKQGVGCTGYMSQIYDTWMSELEKNGQDLSSIKIMENLEVD